MPTSSLAAINNLRQALAIAEQIEKLEVELKSVLSGSTVASAPVTGSPKSKRGGKRTMSPATIAKMKASQQARWAKKKGPSAATATALPPKAVAKPAASPKKKNGGLTPEGRAKLAAAMKARWAARKKGAPALNAPAKSAPATKAKGKAWYAK